VFFREAILPDAPENQQRYPLNYAGLAHLNYGPASTGPITATDKKIQHRSRRALVEDYNVFIVSQSPEDAADKKNAIQR
jgi:hypothetical protein